MSRWVVVGASLVAVFLLGALAGSPALHSNGSADCSALEDTTTKAGEPIHGTHESDMYADIDDKYTDCPVDDAAGMGAPVADGG